MANETQVKVTVNSKELIGEKYFDVIEKLTNMGFNNVSSVPLGDLINEWFKKSGTVKSITVGDASSFREGDIFDKDAIVTISYHSLKNS